MTSNHKLSALLQGRTLTTLDSESAQTLVTWSDGSTLTVQTNEPVTGGPLGAVVHAVRQADTTLIIDFDRGVSLQMTLAASTSSVMVRDRAHVLEYAD